MTDLTEKVIDAIDAAKQKRGATKEEVANAAIVAVLEGVRDRHDLVSWKWKIDALIAQAGMKKCQPRSTQGGTAE